MGRFVNYIIIALLVISLFSVVTPTKVLACSCAPELSPQVKLDQSDAVFVGKVINIQTKQETVSVPGFQPTPLTYFNVTFEVEKLVKGVSSKSVDVSTNTNSASCGYQFNVGKSYLVYAGKDTDETFGTGLCSGNSELSMAADELRQLESPSPQSILRDNKYLIGGSFIFLSILIGLLFKLLKSKGTN